MKRLIPFLLVLICLGGCQFFGGYEIVEKIEECPCNKPGWDVDIYVHHNGKVIYSSYYWLQNDLKCLPLDSVRKYRKIAVLKAEEFIKSYRENIE